MALHPATQQVLRFFRTGHLRPGPIKTMADRFTDFANDLADHCELSEINDPEITVGFRHLLYAKDSFVRAVAVRQEEGESKEGDA